MTSIIVESVQSPALPRADIGQQLRPAFSSETRRLAERVDALRNRRSPAFREPEPAEVKDLAERLFDALAGAKVLTASVAMHLTREWRDKLFSQLDSLHDLAEWEEGDEPLQQSSFATFLKGMLTINPQCRPGLGLSYAGHLIAAWTTDRDRLTIEFLPDDRVRWVLARYRDEEPDRFAGQTPVSRLIEGLAPHQPAHWFGRQ